MNGPSVPGVMSCCSSSTSRSSRSLALEGGLPSGVLVSGVLALDHVAVEAVLVEPCLVAAVHFPELADHVADL
ncbi:hypothetical protein ACFWPV_04875 [Streptomyces uncialis]|uniref:hypothetical protein n=1 Tax=Streptomyces uncialis TaxID=1048205 RepID=UPI0036501891